MIPFISESVSPKKRRADQRLPGAGGRNREGQLNENEVSFSGEENVLEHAVVITANMVHVLNATEFYTLKWLMVDFMFYEFYLGRKRQRGELFC